ATGPGPYPRPEARTCHPAYAPTASCRWPCVHLPRAGSPWVTVRNGVSCGVVQSCGQERPRGARIGSTLRGFHHLPHEQAEQVRVPGTVLVDLLGPFGQDTVHDLLQFAGVRELLEPHRSQELGGLAAPGHHATENVLRRAPRGAPLGDQGGHAPERGPAKRRILDGEVLHLPA